MIFVASGLCGLQKNALGNSLMYGGYRGSRQYQDYIPRPECLDLSALTAPVGGSAVVIQDRVRLSIQPEAILGFISPQYLRGLLGSFSLTICIKLAVKQKKIQN